MHTNTHTRLIRAVRFRSRPLYAAVVSEVRMGVSTVTRDFKRRLEDGISDAQRTLNTPISFSTLEQRCTRDVHVWKTESDARLSSNVRPRPLR